MRSTWGMQTMRMSMSMASSEPTPTNTSSFFTPRQLPYNSLSVHWYGLGYLCGVCGRQPSGGWVLMGSGGGGNKYSTSRGSRCYVAVGERWFDEESLRTVSPPAPPNATHRLISGANWSIPSIGGP
jgi:hypothetical protein